MQNSILSRGGIAKAVQYLSAERSPNILVVDISGVDLPISEIQKLAEVCEPGVTVIVFGTRNDIGLYRDLLQAGVTDYIVKPLTPYLVARSLQAAIEGRQSTRISQKLAKLVAFIGARGGVGTSTLAVNMAWYLANRQNRRVALLDLDLHTGDCGLMLNLKATPGLREALENPIRIDNVFVERAMSLHGERLFLLSAEEPLRDDFEIKPDSLDALVSVLRGQFHYIIADIPRLSGALARRAIDLADIRVIIVDQTLRSVRDAVRLRASLGEDDPEHRNIAVINRASEGGSRSATVDEISGALEMKPRAVIQFQPKFFTDTASKGLVPAAARGGFTDAIEALALDFSGRTPMKRPWWRFGK